MARIQPKVDWKKVVLDPRTKVRLVGPRGTQHYETGSGKLIYWSGTEARGAQAALEKKRQR